jgi:hypothetical protein
MSKQFGLYVNDTLVSVAERPDMLRDKFCAEFGDWVTGGEIGHAPVIRPVSTPPVVAVAVSGSTAAQVTEILAALKQTVRGGTLDLTTTSRHVAGWLSGDWKAKSAIAVQLVASVVGRGVKVNVNLV